MRFLKQKFPNVPIVALTATADRATRKDICIQLQQQQPEVYTASFDRPNLSLQVRPCLLYTSPSPRDQRGSRMPSSA